MKNINPQNNISLAKEEGSKISLNKANVKTKNSSKIVSYTLIRKLITLNNRIKIKIISRLLNLLFDLPKSKVIEFLSFVDNLQECNGSTHAVTVLKCIRLHTTRYLCGAPILTNEIRVGLTPDGFPRRLIWTKEFFDNLRDSTSLLSSFKVRGALSLLTYSRSIERSKLEYKKNPPIINFGAITDPQKGRGYRIPWRFVESFVSRFNLKLETPVYDKSLLYISTKGSPFGSSVVGGPIALVAIAKNYPSLLDSFKQIMGDLSFEDLINRNIKLYQEFPQLLPPICPTLNISDDEFGKLGIVHDPELKTRVVAMLDYYSQFVLRPIHDGLLKLLRSIPCDRTFTQNPFHSWKNSKSKYWSLDLSSATDRFPMSIQFRLMSVIFNKSIAKAWQHILIDREYFYDQSPFKYKVGQPMGAYSSWAAFTLSHHLVVHWAAYLEGYELGSFKDYIILGDDIVIKDNRVAIRYKRIMYKLGVSISEAKTHVSKDTYEFAKRWIHRGKEISGIPLRGIAKHYAKPLLIIGFMLDYVHRVPTLLKSNCLEIIEEIYNGFTICSFFKNKKGKITKVKFKAWTDVKVRSTCIDLFFLIRYARGHLTQFEIRGYLIEKGVLPEFIPKSEKLMPAFMRELFTECSAHLSLKLAPSLRTWYKDWKTSLKLPDDFDMSKLQANPIVNGIYNRLKSITGDFMFNIAENRDFIDLVTQFRFEPIDKLTTLHSDRSVIYSQMGTLWRRALKVIKVINTDKPIAKNDEQWSWQFFHLDYKYANWYRDNRFVQFFKSSTKKIRSEIEDMIDE
jgi:hypothetical protein